MTSVDDYFQGGLNANGLVGRTSMLNERAGQFLRQRAIVTRQLRTED